MHPWIATWLTTRTKKVIMEAERDLKITIKGCYQEYVPQGTVLGPFYVFTVY